MRKRETERERERERERNRERERERERERGGKRRDEIQVTLLTRQNVEGSCMSHTAQA